VPVGYLGCPVDPLIILETGTMEVVTRPLTLIVITADDREEGVSSEG
jgi:hypothetical protein